MNNEQPKPTEVVKAGISPIFKKLTPKGQDPALYLKLVKEQVMGVDKNGKQRPDGDFQLFLYFAHRTGLDPLAKQIHAVFRWDSTLGRDKMAIQTSIDGMRLVAQRTKDYAGMDDIKYTPEDEATKYPTKATCTVHKFVNGQRVEFVASARWNEYAQVYNGKVAIMWDKMPYLMLGKCAEALALRKAFPNELSGLYTDDEMAQPTGNVLGDIPTPEKFKKEEEIVVEHGKPEEVADEKAPDIAGTEKTQEAAPQTPDTPDFKGMRDKLKEGNK